MVKRSNIEIGKWGERIAKGVLIASQWTIVTTNYRSPYGEIDIVASKGNELVFVEVKARTNTSYGMPEEAITDEKLEHIIHTAQHYLQENPAPDINWRIDVIAILGKPGDDIPQIRWFKNVLD